MSNSKFISVGVGSPTEINAPRGCAVILIGICQLRWPEPRAKSHGRSTWMLKKQKTPMTHLWITDAFRSRGRGIRTPINGFGDRDEHPESIVKWRIFRISDIFSDSSNIWYWWSVSTISFSYVMFGTPRASLYCWERCCLWRRKNWKRKSNLQTRNL